MKYLSDKHIRVIQVVNLLVIVLVLLLAVFLWIVHRSAIVGIRVLFVGLIFWAPVFLLSLKLFEIKIVTAQDVSVSNLFRKYRFNKDDVVDINPTIFPLLYNISFKGADTFFFMIPVENIFKLLFVNSEKIIAEMRLELKLQSQSGGRIDGHGK